MIEGMGTEVYFGLITGFIAFLLMYLILRRVFRNPDREHIYDETAQGGNGRPPIYNPNCCPICLGGQSFPLETNCGHLYCGPCLHRHFVITGRGDSSGIVCAMCRQRVVLIFICFNNEERNETLDPNVLETRDDLVQFVRMYNRIVRNDLTLMERISELPVLLRHLVEDSVRGELMVGFDYFRLRLMIFVGITVAYVVLPFDIFPELIYGIYGYTEDVLLFIIMTMYILVVYRNFIANA